MFWRRKKSQSSNTVIEDVSEEMAKTSEAERSVCLIQTIETCSAVLTIARNVLQGKVQGHYARIDARTSKFSQVIGRFPVAMHVVTMLGFVEEEAPAPLPTTDSQPDSLRGSHDVGSLLVYRGTCDLKSVAEIVRLLEAHLDYLETQPFEDEAPISCVYSNPSKPLPPPPLISPSLPSPPRSPMSPTLRSAAHSQHSPLSPTRPHSPIRAMSPTKITSPLRALRSPASLASSEKLLGSSMDSPSRFNLSAKDFDLDSSDASFTQQDSFTPLGPF